MKLKSRYHLISLLNSNSVSKTFLAIDEASDVARKCAIEQFKLPAVQRFNLDVLNSEKLYPPVYFPKLLDIFWEDERLYIVREYLEGTNLKQVLEEQGVFNESQIWRLLNDVLTALERLHQFNWIHKNIKPTSIIQLDANVSTRNTYRLLSPDISQTFVELNLPNIPNPEYSAPEQLNDEAIFASDLYSLGVTCIYLLTGLRPFELLDLTNNSWIWQDYLLTKISASLERAIAKLIESDIDKRFSSVDLVLKAINTDPLSYLVAKSHQKTSNNKAIAWQCIRNLDLSSCGFGNINSIALNPKEDTLAIARENKNIQLWDLTHNSQIATFSGHSSTVNSVAFSLDGKAIASASDDKTIKIWQVENCAEIATLTGHTNKVKSVTYSPCGRFIASASWDKTIKLWDSYTFAEIATIAGHKLQVNSVALSPDGKLLASASCDRNINLWDISRLDAPQLVSTLKGHLWAVTAIAFHPESNILASGSDDNTIKMWDCQTGQLLNTINAHSRSVSSLKFIDRGENLISASGDTKLKLWCLKSGDEIVTLSGHHEAVSCVVISQDNRTIISGSQDRTVKIWQQVE